MLGRIRNVLSSRRELAILRREVERLRGELKRSQGERDEAEQQHAVETATLGQRIAHLEHVIEDGLLDPRPWRTIAKFTSRAELAGELAQQRRDLAELPALRGWPLAVTVTRDPDTYAPIQAHADNMTIQISDGPIYVEAPLAVARVLAHVLVHLTGAKAPA